MTNARERVLQVHHMQIVLHCIQGTVVNDMACGVVSLYLTNHMQLVMALGKHKPWCSENCFVRSQRENALTEHDH